MIYSWSGSTLAHTGHRRGESRDISLDAGAVYINALLSLCIDPSGMQACNCHDVHGPHPLMSYYI